MSLFVLVILLVTRCLCYQYIDIPASYDRTCNPMDYGAKGDGKTNDTEGIQRAMNDCFGSGGGGQVYLPSKHSFVSSALSFTSSSSNIAFTLHANSVLIISNDRAAWPDGQDFITLKNIQNMVFEGPGEIHGQGEVWWQHDTDFRPRTLYAHGAGFLVRNILIQNPPTHCLEMYTDSTELENVTILAPPSTGTSNPSHNTDAVDVHGQPFYVHDCYFDTGDDNIAAHANDTLVENCYFGSGHGASIGSLGGGWYKNITFDNIYFNGTTNGIRIKTDSGATAGKVWDVTYSNLVMNNVQNPILITQFYGSGKTEQSYLVIDGVLIENVTAQHSTKTAGNFDCQPSTPCHHIALNHVDIESADNFKFECENAFGSASSVEPPSCLKSE